MIATKIHEVYEVDLPAELSTLLNSIAVTISFGFSSAGTVLECLGMRGYFASLATYIAAPIILAAFILIVTLVRLLSKCNCTSTTLLEAAVPGLLELLFLACTYPPIEPSTFGSRRIR